MAYGPQGFSTQASGFHYVVTWLFERYLVRSRLYNIVCNNVTGPVLFLFSLEPAVKYHGITFAPLCSATCGFDASALSPAPTLRR